MTVRGDPHKPFPGDSSGNGDRDALQAKAGQKSQAKPQGIFLGKQNPISCANERCQSTSQTFHGPPKSKKINFPRRLNRGCGEHQCRTRTLKKSPALQQIKAGLTIFTMQAGIITWPCVQFISSPKFAPIILDRAPASPLETIEKYLPSKNDT
jgi:hypothetical protein